MAQQQQQQQPYAADVAYMEELYKQAAYIAEHGTRDELLAICNEQVRLHIKLRSISNYL